jgi:hypothetical protein
VRASPIKGENPTSNALISMAVTRSWGNQADLTSKKGNHEDLCFSRTIFSCLE